MTLFLFHNGISELQHNGIFLCDFLENKSPKEDKKHAEGWKFQARGPRQGSEGLKFSAWNMLLYPWGSLFYKKSLKTHFFI